MALTILYVEDDRIVADAVRDLLEEEGWRVDHCSDGSSALNRIAGDARYDLLLFDNGLPGADGLELARYARGLQRHQRTPIVMLSASDVAADARHAGVDVFLRKPDDIRSLADTVSRLLTEAERNDD